jgi:hypothetical protein
MRKILIMGIVLMFFSLTPGVRIEGNCKIEPGDILTLKYLGTDSPIISYGKYDVAVFFMEYWSDVENGVRIAAKIFIPIGSPPREGWPVKVWLHEFGGPGYDFWLWPFSGENWRERGYHVGMAFANHGVVSLCPWVAGAGPSEPFATYSPFSLQRNAQVAFDGFAALKKLKDYFDDHPELKQPGMEVKLDHSRQIMSTNCISSPTLIYFASKWKEHPEVNGLKALVADTFQPSIAYHLHFLYPPCMQLEDDFSAAGLLGLWAGTIWCLAEQKGWDMHLFFTDESIELFQLPVETPAGTMGLMRSAQLEPIEDSHVAGPILEAVREDLGYDPSPTEIAEWIFTDDMRRLGNYETIEEILQDEFYQTYFADSDPFFEENIEPFSPSVPLLVVASGSEASWVHGMPTEAERYWGMIKPKVETLRSWGWDVRVFFELGVPARSWKEGPGHAWTTYQLRNILYPMEIEKPKAGYLYIFDREIIPISMGTIIIGGITIETGPEFAKYGIDRVEFYVDNVLKSTDTQSPYTWLWDEKAFGKHEIKTIAYDKKGNTTEDEIDVIIFNLGGVE